MSVLDVVIAVAAVLAVVGGYRLGLVTRVLSWVGLAVGLVVGVRLLPLLLDRLDTSAHTTILLLTVGFLLVAASLGQALGFLVGGRLRPRAATGTLSTADRVLGAGAGLVGVVVLVWLVTPVLVATPGWLARQATNSWVVRTVDDALPPPPEAPRVPRPRRTRLQLLRRDVVHPRTTPSTGAPRGTPAPPACSCTKHARDPCPCPCPRVSRRGLPTTTVPPSLLTTNGP